MSGPTASASRSGTPSSTSCATRSGNSTSRTCCTPTAGRRPATSHPQATSGGSPGSAPSSLTRRGLMKTTDTCAAPEGQAIPVTGTSWKDTALVALDLEGSGAQDRENEDILEIATVPIIGGRPAAGDAYATVINPGRPIPRRRWISPGLTPHHPPP